VYFGGAREMDSATPAPIAAGTQARADFTLPVEPTYKVRGSLGNFTPHQAVVFELLENDPNVAGSRVSLNAASGRFEIDDVPSGQYTLRATQGYLARGEVHVAVSGADVNGVSIPLTPAVTVSGAFRVIGQLPEPAAASQPGPGSERGVVGSPFCTLSLQSGLARNALQAAAQLRKPEFTIPNVLEGRYDVRLSCHGGYITSAVSGSSDLLVEPALTVQPGVPPPPIEITVKVGGGAVHGKLPVSTGNDYARVLLVPSFAASTGPVVLNMSGGEEGPESWEFFQKDLAPGDYIAYALSHLGDFEYRNPEVLRTLPGGVGVRVEEGKTSEITLPGLVK
jgi:hypothetical protein